MKVCNETGISYTHGRVNYFDFFIYTHKYIYRCPSRNERDFGKVFLMLNYSVVTQNTCIQSLTVTEIMARDV